MMVCLALSACSSDDQFTDSGSPVYSDTVDVKFDMSLPAELQTRAYGDGTSATHLVYAVYDKNGTFLFDNAPENIDFPKGELQRQVSIRLVNGESYKIVFYAQSPDNESYTFDMQSATLSVNYTTVGDETTLNVADLNNNEQLDAFYVVKEITVDPDNLNISAELRRPFAQLNIATADKQAFQTQTVEYPSQSQVTFSGIPTTLNLLTGEVGNERTSLTFSFNNIPTDPDKITVDGKEYDALSMTYVLAPKEEGFVQEHIIFQVNNLTVGDRTYHNIPLRRNYKTNIVGNLLTSKTIWDVHVNPEWDKPDFDEIFNEDTSKNNPAGNSK